ncbi:MAG: ABC transporter substrate-binding protein [bacterium]|jgi:multiple sugar transport system substrate-binding protein
MEKLNDNQPTSISEETTEKGMTRRQVIKTGAAAAGAIALVGGFPYISSAQNKTLTIVRGTHFIPEAQEVAKQQAEEFGKQAGVKVNADFLNWPDLQPKIGAALQAGGIDVVELWPIQNHLYATNLVDMTDEAEEVGARGGGFEEYVLNSASVNGRYLGIPHGDSGGTIAYRISAFQKAGVKNAADGSLLDMTWDDYFAVAKETKKMGMPFGQSLGHSLGDPIGFCYPYMWSSGALEVADDGKTVLFDTPTFEYALNKFVQAWKDGYDETGTSWDDSSNNRAYLSEKIASTFNGSSIYYATKKRDDGGAMMNDTHHMLMPKGTAGRYYEAGSRTMAVLKNSPNIEVAKEYLKWWFQPENYYKWWGIQEGYQMHHVKNLANDPVWNSDPKMAAFRKIPGLGRLRGFAGDPNEKAGLAASKYVIVDTFAKAVQSGDAKDALQWGQRQLERIYR